MMDQRYNHNDSSGQNALLRQSTQPFADIEAYNSFFSTVNRYSCQVLELIDMGRERAQVH